MFVFSYIKVFLLLRKTLRLLNLVFPTEDIIAIILFFPLILRSSVSCWRPSYYSDVSSSSLLRSSVSNGRPYCYSIVSFSLLLLRSSVFNGRPYCYSSVSFSLLLLFFILLDFSQTPGRIIMKFPGKMSFGNIILLAKIRCKIHFRSRVISHLVTF